MAIVNYNPYYFVNESLPNYSVARSTALDVMGEARRFDENIRVGFVNMYYVNGLKHYRMSGVEISKNNLLNELIDALFSGNVLRIDDYEWSI